MNGLLDFLETPNINLQNNKKFSDPLKLANHVHFVTGEYDSLEDAAIVLIGCGAQYGKENDAWSYGADKIRESFYSLYNWYNNSVKIADLGNIKQGATPTDTRAALKAVLKEIEHAGKTALLLGGTQDLMLQQYQVFEEKEQVIELSAVDRFIDLEDSEGLNERNYLMPLLTRQPNYAGQYNHFGFQSYDVSPHVLETLDKLGFDCVRLGKLKETLKEAEPIFRQSHLIAIDLQVLRYSEAGFLPDASPNGLWGDELCQLMHYAGMSSELSSLGIFGYQEENDANGKGAQLIAQMLWYFMDGVRVGKTEAVPDDEQNFISFFVKIDGTDTLFRKSKRTNRWWMQLLDGQLIPCSYNDYLIASQGDAPERWMRFQSRMI